MAFKFPDDWAADVASVTGDPEFQTARVRIWIETDPGEFDLDTNTWDPPATLNILYEGQARVIGVRWNVFQQAAASMNSQSQQQVRVQVPRHALPRVLSGAVVKVLEAPYNPALVGALLMVENDFQGSSSATRTLECGFSTDTPVT